MIEGLLATFAPWIASFGAILACFWSASSAGTFIMRKAVTIFTYIYVSLVTLCGFLIRDMRPFEWVAAGLFLTYAVVLRIHRVWECRRWADGVGAILIDKPFAGKWKIVAGGPADRKNHHWTASDQRFAYDFIAKNGETFGAEIVSPVDGTIVEVRDGSEDHAWQDAAKRRLIHGREAFGNYVLIGAEQGNFFLCHLKKGTVQVKIGDFVRRGERIGKCGDSGRSYGPHLHVHAQREPAVAINKTDGLPIQFSNDGVTTAPSRGDVI